MSEKVRASGADIGLGFDGDGDRCGIVDNQGREVFADKIGVLLARQFSADHPAAKFVVDVKSTVLFQTDPVLVKNRAAVEYWKTGHSYIKQRVHQTGALAGFEKSGHYFFGPPFGRGYDDGVLSAIAILDLLERHPAASMAELVDSLPVTWGSPTMSAVCPDDLKYDVTSRVSDRLEALRSNGDRPNGHAIADLITVNGVRAVMDDGSWGLVRASSNKPEMVVVVESPVSEQRMRDMFRLMDTLLREIPGVGAYNQTI